MDCFWLLGLQLCFEPPYNGVAVGAGIFVIVVRNVLFEEKEVRQDPQANELIHSLGSIPFVCTLGRWIRNHGIRVGTPTIQARVLEIEWILFVFDVLMTEEFYDFFSNSLLLSR